MQRLPAMPERFRKPALILGMVLLLYTVFGFLVVPALLKFELPDIIDGQIRRNTFVRGARFNPFTFALSLHGFEITERDGQKFAGFDEFFVNFEPIRSIWEMIISFDEVRLVNPFGRAERLPDGGFNFSDLMTSSNDQEKPREKDENEEMIRVAISKLALREGEFVWKDSSAETPAQAVFYPLNVDLQHFSTRLDHGADMRVGIGFDDGTQLSWIGSLSVNPMRSKGRISLENGKTRRIWQLALQDSVGFEIKKGRHRYQTDFRMDLSGETPQVELTNGVFREENLTLTQKGNETSLIEIPSLSVQGIDVNLAEQTVNLALIESQSANFLAWLDSNGVLNYEKLFAVQANKKTPRPPSSSLGSADAAYGKDENKVLKLKAVKSQAETSGDIPSGEFPTKQASQNSAKHVTDTPSSAEKNGKEKHHGATADGGSAASGEGPARKPGKAPARLNSNQRQDPPSGDMPWLLQIAKIEVTGWGLEFEDRSQQRTAGLKLSPMNVSIKDLSTKAGERLQLDAYITVNKRGQVKVGGDIGIDPLSTDLNLKIDQVALSDFQPYLDSAAHLNLVKGELNVNGKLKVSFGQNDQPTIRYSGNAGVVNLQTQDTNAGNDFVNWKALEFNDIEFGSDPTTLTINEIVTDGAFARVIINKDGSTNLDSIFPATNEKSGDKTEISSSEKTNDDSSGDAVPFPISIGTVKINNASAYFADSSLIIPFRTNLASLNGAVKGLSSDKNARADVYLSGKVDRVSPVKIVGRINPFHAGTFSDIGMEFKNVNLTSATPYMAHFAGYKVEKGRISLDLSYKISNRKLTADNKVIINRLTLGEEIESPDAVSLPLKFAIALLQDANGVIDLDLPLKGSLDDPEFSVLPLLGKVLVNLITKAVTAPFGLLADLAGSDDDLSRIIFAAGAADLDAQQQQRLDDIAIGLKERPELQLEIKGSAFEELDWPIVAEQRLLEELKRLRWNELNEDGEAPSSVEKVVLSDEEYNRLLDIQFSLKFPESDDKDRIVESSTSADPVQEFYGFAKKRLLEKMPINRERLRLLAKTRAQNIFEYLVETGGILDDRIYILGLTVEATSKNGIAADLSLTAS